MGCAAWTSGAASGARSGTSSTKGTPIEQFTTRALGAPDGGRRHRARRGHRRAAPARRCPRAPAGTIQLRIGRLHGRPPKAGYAWTRKTTRGLSARRRPRRRPRHRSGRRDSHGRGGSRADADRRRRAARHRQSHRPGAGDGRRLQLRAEQVQPCRAGVPAARVHVQADRLHGRHRSRLHARLDAARRAGGVPAGPGQPVYSPQNYDRTFKGPVTLRYALEESRNVPTVRLLEALGAEGGDRVRAGDSASRAQLPPYLSLAPRLGRSDAARSDERLHGLPEPGRAHAALRRAQGPRSRGQPARGEAARSRTTRSAPTRLT